MPVSYPVLYVAIRLQTIWQLCVALGWGFASEAAQAQTYQWVDGLGARYTLSGAWSPFVPNYFPGQNDAIVFNLPDTYSVTWEDPNNFDPGSLHGYTGHTQTRSLEILDGNVTFELGFEFGGHSGFKSHTVSGNAYINNSIFNLNSDASIFHWMQLNVGSVFWLDSAEANIGNNSRLDTNDVLLIGSGSSLNVMGQLRVHNRAWIHPVGGGSFLTIAGGSADIFQLDIEEMSASGHGLTVSDNGRLETQVGNVMGSNTTALIGRGTWKSTNLQVLDHGSIHIDGLGFLDTQTVDLGGNFGGGSVFVRGAWDNSQRITIGRNQSMVTVQNQGVLTTNELVLQEGGILAIEEGGRVGISLAEIGNSNGGGIATVNGRWDLTPVPNLQRVIRVGTGQGGILNVGSTGYVSATSIEVATSSSAFSQVWVVGDGAENFNNLKGRLSTQEMFLGGSKTQGGGVAHLYVDNFGRVDVNDVLKVWAGGSIFLSNHGEIRVRELDISHADPNSAIQGGLIVADTIVGNMVLANNTSLAPGFSPDQSIVPGTLTIEGDWTWGSGSIVVFDLGNASSSSDLIAVDGRFLQSPLEGGEWLFDFKNNGWVVGNTYNLIQFESTNFSNADIFEVANETSLAGRFAFVGNTLQFTLIAVPEPNSIGLGLLLLACSFWAIRRSVSV